MFFASTGDMFFELTWALRGFWVLALCAPWAGHFKNNNTMARAFGPVPLEARCAHKKGRWPLAAVPAFAATNRHSVATCISGTARCAPLPDGALPFRDVRGFLVLDLPNKSYPKQPRVMKIGHLFSTAPI